MLQFTKENALVHLILVVLGSFGSIKLLDLAIRNDYSSKNLLDKEKFYSSIWCSGNDHNNRRCRTTNICYDGNHDQFLFINAPASIASGLPDDLFSPALITLSSVEDHNQYYFNFVTIDKKFLSNFTDNYIVTLVEHPTLIFGRFKPDNLMHSLHDDLIPLWWTLMGQGWERDYSLFAYDQWPAYDEIAFNRIFYNKLFQFNHIYHRSLLAEKTVSTTGPSKKLLCFKEALLGVDTETVWYQYGFRYPQGPKNTTKSKKSNVFKAAKMLNQLFTNDDHKCETPYGIILSRLNNRRLLNEREIIDFVSENIPLIPLAIDYQHSESIITAIEKISCASLLIGMHGSALVLSLFLQEGSHLIELFPYGLNPSHYTPYKTLAHYKKLNYHHWTNRNVSNTLTHPEYPIHLGGINHLPDDEKAKILALDKELPPHLCCDNPNWLFRIHQDTIVELNDFASQVELDKIITDILSKRNEVNPIFFEGLFLPGPVINITCKYLDTGVFLVLWEKPWNLIYSVTNDEISYEFIANDQAGSATSIVTSVNIVEIPMHSIKKEEFLVWVRCRVGQKKGAFRYAKCLKK